MALIFTLNVKNISFLKIYIFNRNKHSIGAIFCKNKKFNYFDAGIYGLIKKINVNKINCIFDATSAESSIINDKILRPYVKNNFYINLTPSKIGDYVVPYDSFKKIPKKSNLITCGGQSSIPLIMQLNESLGNIIYVELVSSIASVNAGKAKEKI